MADAVVGCDKIARGGVAKLEGLGGGVLDDVRSGVQKRGDIT